MKTILMLCLVMLSAASAAAEKSILVLSVKSYSVESGDVVLVTLASGATVKIPALDVEVDLTRLVQSTLDQHESERRISSSAAPPTEDQAGAVIRAKCATDWKDDFSMREYCERKQREGLGRLRSRPADSSTMRTIREKCARDWQNDFSMRDYCEQKQVKSARELQQ